MIGHPSGPMMVYVGQTRARWLTAELACLGWGECTNRGELPPRRAPWFFDNGAFSDWKAGKPWDRAAYEEDLKLLREHRTCRPDFLVVPDIVGGGANSLDKSRQWLPEVRTIAPAYLAVQDGMEITAETANGFNGIFVGGTLEWKMQTFHDWVILGHRIGVPVHVGRVGTGKRVRRVKEVGPSSIDSSLPLWSKDNLRIFRQALDDWQCPLFPEKHETDEELRTMLADYEYHSKRQHALAGRITKRSGECSDPMSRAV